MSLDGAKESVMEAHKFVLMSRSPVFSAMIRWAPPEKGDLEIVLDDADPEAVDRVLK